MKYFPFYIDLKKKSVLLIGGGEVAERKLDLLIKAKANVTLISPETTPYILDIAEKNNIIHFIEVKSGKSNFENLLYKLNSTKQKKIIKTALDYLTKNKINNTQINFIYMIVYKNKIRYYDNAIPLDLNKI